MKSLVIAAVLALTLTAVRAAELTVDVAGRGELLQEMESWRTLHLQSATQSVFWTYAPRLKAIRERVEAAAEAQALAEPKKDFEDWKNALLREEYAEVRTAGMGGGSGFASYRLGQNVTAQMMTQVQLASVDGARAFDGSAASGSADAVAAPAPLAVDDPARYAKIRRIMISQGAQPRIVDAAIKESIHQGVDPALTLSVIWQESRFKAGATSVVGARGLMQLMPETGRDMGVHDSGRLYDVRTNLRAGIKYLRWAADYLHLGVSLRDITEVPANKIKALLASYNAGVGTVSNWLRRQGRDLTRIPYQETRHYVRVIGDKLASLIATLTA